MFGSALHRFRVVGYLEGTSFLLLLGVAMPVKYLLGEPKMVRIVGWAHGLLFILFLAAVADCAVRMRWPWKRIAAAVAAALLPFGPFVFDARLRRDERGAVDRVDDH